MKLIFPLVISAVLLCLCSTQNPCYANTPNNPQHLLPTSPLYVFKTLYESARIFFTFDPLGKAELLLGQAETRLEEAKAIIEQGNTQTAIKLLLTNTDYLTKAQNYLEKVTKTPQTGGVAHKLKQNMYTYKQKLVDLGNIQNYDFTETVKAVDDKNKQVLKQIADQIDNLGGGEQKHSQKQTPTKYTNIMERLRHLFRQEYVSPIVEN